MQVLILLLLAMPMSSQTAAESSAMASASAPAGTPKPGPWQLQDSKRLWHKAVQQYRDMAFPEGAVPSAVTTAAAGGGHGGKGVHGSGHGSGHGTSHGQQGLSVALTVGGEGEFEAAVAGCDSAGASSGSTGPCKLAVRGARLVAPDRVEMEVDGERWVLGNCNWNSDVRGGDQRTCLESGSAGLEEGHLPTSARIRASAVTAGGGWDRAPRGMPEAVQTCRRCPAPSIPRAGSSRTWRSTLCQAGGNERWCCGQAAARTSSGLPEMGVGVGAEIGPAGQAGGVAAVHFIWAGQVRDPCSPVLHLPALPSPPHLTFTFIHQLSTLNLRPTPGGPCPPGARMCSSSTGGTGQVAAARRWRQAVCLRPCLAEWSRC